MHKYRILFHYARQRRSIFVFILILTVAASILAALQPWPMALIVDQVLGQKPLPPLLQRALRVLAINPTPSSLTALAALGGLAFVALSSSLEVGLTWASTMAG